jgi:hypothetical protein
MKAVGDTFIVANPRNNREHFYIVIGWTENGDPIAVNKIIEAAQASRLFPDVLKRHVHVQG